MNKDFPATKLSALTARAVVDNIAKLETNVIHLILIYVFSGIVLRWFGRDVCRGFRKVTKRNEKIDSNNQN